MSKKFKKDNYLVIKKAVSEEICKFATDYLMLKRQVSQRLHDKKMIEKDNLGWGTFGDTQVPFSYNHYSDTAMEILLIKIKPIIEKKIKKEIVPTYSYARIYEHGDTLHRHKDRYSCEISTTMNIGGDSWPIFVEPDVEKGKENNDGTYNPGNTSGIKVVLEPGDMLVYRGHDCEHWREPFEGQDCDQVFLHYNHRNGPFAEKNKFDNRPLLGIPSFIKS